MQTEESRTLEKILEAAKEEFLEKGFQKASLRNIVKMAGVTTGAFYRYYSSKEALFAALVEPHATAVMGKYMQTLNDFEELSGEEQTAQMGNASGGCIAWILDYVYEHYDEFRLLICCADGTSYENFVHNMVEVEVESTYKYIEVLRAMGHPVSDIDKQLCHMVASGMFSGMFEMIVHNMSKEEAVRCVGQLRQFYTAGWEKLMGVEFR